MSSDHAELLQERAEYAASQAPTPSDIKLRDDEIRRINNAIQPPCTELEQAIQLRDVYRADLRNVERAIEEAKKTNSGVSTENITRAENRAASIKDDIAEIDAQIGGFVGKHATLFHNPERTPEEQAEYESCFELYVKRQELVDEYEQVEEVKPTTQEGIACRASNRERCKAAIAAIDAKLEGKAGGVIKLTDRQQAQMVLIEAVRARLVDRYNAGDTPNRTSAIRHLMSTGVLQRSLRNLGYKGSDFEGKARKLTDPNQMPNLGLSRGYLKPPF